MITFNGIEAVVITAIQEMETFGKRKDIGLWDVYSVLGLSLRSGIHKYYFNLNVPEFSLGVDWIIW
ncbi:hypothetical protein Asal01_01293 [Fodinibius salicampi]